MFARAQRTGLMATRVARKAHVLCRARRCYAGYSSDKGSGGGRQFSVWECAAGMAVCAIGGAGAGAYLGTRRTEDELGSEVSRLNAHTTIDIGSSDVTEAEYRTNDLRPMHDRMEAFVLDLQGRLVAALEGLDPSSQKFVWDRWERGDGHGYGISCVLQGGAALEKAGVNVSVISGTLAPGQLSSMRNRRAQAAGQLRGSEEYDFRVAGISVVVHPRNPYAPTAHMNYRRFEVFPKGAAEGSAPVLSWFGGGADLTPAYLFPEDAQHFHQTLKDTCDAHDSSYYPRFKAWCDQYFTNVHRGETRGVGGIFFDDLDDKDPERVFQFACDAGNAFIGAYVPLVARRMGTAYTQRQRDWQLIRRGHYAEFNLVYDRGTKFGLMTPGARIESILMSLPLTARWEYMNEPDPGSPEDVLLRAVRTTTDWTT
ncbi:Coproporphyrinogen-III oxidase [Coemansia sp. BCRC 34301]|nr:Coproporphyrinogen-III oxidase [Coemansia sp. BCRC 34301]